VRPRLLDLFCGAGGAAVGYHRAGFEVVGVDIEPQPHYQFEFVQGDALLLLWAFGKEFDLIHASPPCQRYSMASKRWNGRADTHPDLVAEVRRLLYQTGKSWVIENVPGAPLIDPVRLCGSWFGLGVQRHRLFESNLPIGGTPCTHYAQPFKYRIYDHGRWYLSRVAHVHGHGGGGSKGSWPEAMGVDWPMTNREMAQAIPPAYTEFVGRQILGMEVTPEV
jgi:DNA (cytosine-5)-methyltransferase 1